MRERCECPSAGNALGQLVVEFENETLVRSYLQAAKRSWMINRSGQAGDCR